MQPNELDILLTKIISSTVGVTDFVFVTGKPPQIDSDGRLHSFDAEPALTSATINRLAELVLNTNTHLQRDLAKTGSCDCSYAIKSGMRFRINIYRQNGNYAMVLRRLPSAIPTFEELSLPSIFQEVVQEKSGLVFITGGSGTGKTTTAAAILNEINQQAEVHVVTLEDPIEFLHPHHVATFSHRELGRDFFNFADGLKAALRQLPKVIFIGEIRDRATMELALTAAETGYLVCTTMHTPNAAQTVSRILGFFDKEEEEQIRQRLAETVRFIISQRLLPKMGGRFLATEVMGNNRRTREAIALGENENRRLTDIIEAAENVGWHSFEQCLLKAYVQNLVTEETAVSAATNKTHMRQMIDAARKQHEGLQVTETIKMKEDSIEPSVPPVQLPEEQQAEAPAEQTFIMSCPKCAGAAELPMSYYDMLVECPACKEAVLARPIESQEMLSEATREIELIPMLAMADDGIGKPAESLPGQPAEPPVPRMPADFGHKAA